jgi:hypothetical protein
MLIGEINDILSKEIIEKEEEFDNRNKFDRLSEAIRRLALEIDKNKIELEGLLNSKIIFRNLAGDKLI